MLDELPHADPQVAAKALLESYRYQRLSQATVTFEIPIGESPISVLRAVQPIGQKLYGLSPVWPSRLEYWSGLSEFQAPSNVAQKLKVTAITPGSTKKTRAEVIEFFEKSGLTMAELPHVAIAHALHFLDTGEDLFDGMIIRVVGGKLYYGDGGLSFMDESDYIDSCRYKHVAAGTEKS